MKNNKQFSQHVRRASPSVKQRVQCMDRVLQIYYEETEVSALGAAILFMADIVACAEDWSESHINMLVDSAYARVERERRGSAIWTECWTDWSHLPLQAGTDREDRDSRLGRADTLLRLASQCSVDSAVIDILADLGHWCRARGLQPPESLLEKALVLNARGRRLVH